MSIYSWKLMQIIIGSEGEIQWPSQSTSKPEHSCSEPVPVFFLISIGSSGLFNEEIHLGLRWGVDLRWNDEFCADILKYFHVWTSLYPPVIQNSLYPGPCHPSSTNFKVQLTLWTCLAHRSDWPSLFCRRETPDNQCLLWSHCMCKPSVSPIQMPTVFTVRCTNNELLWLTSTLLYSTKGVRKFPDMIQREKEGLIL